MMPDWTEFNRLFKSYGAKGRFHHSHDHIIYGVRLIGKGFRYEISDYFLALMKLAFIYHDAVYLMTVEHGYNEKASAHLFRAYLFGSNVRQESIDRMAGFIVNTMDHQNTPNDDHLWQFFNDADLAILATSPKTYFRYADHVWQEYSAVYGREDFVRGRIKFLSNFLKKTIFRTDHFVAVLEKVAVKNMMDEIERLREEEATFA
jgi:predicted metal-dependent HD superfamily phosphohydrolase